MGNVLLIALMVMVVLCAMLWFFRSSRQPVGGDSEVALHVHRIGDGLRRLESNKRKYATLTPALLAETEDDVLLEATLSNLWAKMQPDLSDAWPVMAAQSEARRALYALYWVTGEIQQDGFAALGTAHGGDWASLALSALDGFGMRESAILLRAAMEAPDPESYRSPYLEAFKGEDGKARMVAYIRSRPEAFVDAPAG